MRVPYKDLPPRLKEAVNDILNHRGQLNSNARGVIGATILIPIFNEFASANTPGRHMPESRTHLISAVGTGIVASFGSLLLRDHRDQFRQEYVKLFFALREAATKKAVKKLLAAPNAHYICVNKDGSLETREHLPKQVFKLPIGRRLVANPMAAREKIQAWKRSLPKRKRRH